MTLDKARELIQVQLSFGGGYNRNAVRLILAEISIARLVTLLEFAFELLDLRGLVENLGNVHEPDAMRPPVVLGKCRDRQEGHH